MGSNTHVKVRDKGKELTAQHTTTDSPILPTAQLIELKEHMPERVSWVFEQTELESTHRRKLESRVDWFIFTERLIGSLFGLLTVGGALYVAYVLAMAGKEIVASVIVGGTLASVVATFVYGREGKKKSGS